MTRAPVASILILTEDGSNHASATIEMLVRELLRHCSPGIRVDRLDFEPANEDARKLLAGNQFPDAKKYIERTRLHQTIADKLVAEDGFVFQHIDADRRWKERERNPSVNLANLERHILIPVRRLVDARYRGSSPRPRRRKALQTNGLTEAELTSKVNERMTRYIRLVPYREIEAWLYQNTRVATRLCQANPRCRGVHATQLAAWAADRGALDEVEHPSDALCFGKHHNSELVRGYPTAEVVAAGKSLAAAVDAMLGCDALLHAIQRTYETSPGVLEST